MGDFNLQSMASRGRYGCHQNQRRRAATIVLMVLGTCAPEAQCRAESLFDDGELSTIVVTAQKTPQDEREVPLSIGVLDGDKLDRSKIDTTDDLARYIPNAHFNGPDLYLRGVGTSASLRAQGFDPSVAIFIDGVYYGRATAALAPLLDLEQVEVIRGPQGTLLGKNTIGGAVNLTTRSLDEDFSGSVSGLAGDLHTRGYKAVVNVPWTEDFGMRLAVMDERREGHLFNSTLDSRDFGRDLRGARAKFAWDAGGPLSAWLSVESGRQRYQGLGAQLIAATDASLGAYRVFDPMTEADRSDAQSSSDMRGAGEARKGRSSTLHARYEWRGATLTWLSNMAHARYGFDADTDFSPAPLITQSSGEVYRQWSQELRLHGELAETGYVVGAYYLDADLDIDNLIVGFPDGATALTPALLDGPALAPLFAQLVAGGMPLDPARDESRKDFRQQGRSLAFFGQITWPFAERWSLTGGLRWTTEQKRVDATNTFARSGLYFTQLLGEEAYDVHRSRRETDYSPRVALQYEWSPEITSYASAARGSKAGGFNAIAARADSLDFSGEQAETLEAGMKALLLQRQLSMNLSLFTTRFQNLQVENFDGTRFVIQNAAQAKIRGGELETRWLLGQGWSSFANLGYLDARYSQYPDAPAQADPAAVPGATSSTQDLSGERLQHAPKWSGALGIEVQFAPWSAALRCNAGIDALYRSRTFLNVDNDPIDSQKSYWQLNSAMRVAFGDSGLSLSVVGLNLTDEVILVEAADVFLFAGNHWGRIAPGRIWSATLEWEW